MAISHLGFSTTLATDARDLADVAELRAAAYGHHVPGLATSLAEPDPIDQQPGTVVLLCRDKASGAAIGTARIQRNHPLPLQIERSVRLPQRLTADPRVEFTRLAVRPGADPLVRAMLFKACWLHSLAAHIRWVVIGARSPALVRIYRSLGLTEVWGAGTQVPLAHAGNLPHYVLAGEIAAAERIWRMSNPAMYHFAVQTFHPDLQLLPSTQPVTASLPLAA